MISRVRDPTQTCRLPPSHRSTSDTTYTSLAEAFLQLQTLICTQAAQRDGIFKRPNSVHREINFSLSHWIFAQYRIPSCISILRDVTTARERCFQLSTVHIQGATLSSVQVSSTVFLAGVEQKNDQRNVDIRFVISHRPHAAVLVNLRWPPI